MLSEKSFGQSFFSNLLLCTQEKFWITDPNGNEWEFFYTKTDVEKMDSYESGECCSSDPQQREACCEPDIQKVDLLNRA